MSMIHKTFYLFTKIRQFLIYQEWDFPFSFFSLALDIEPMASALSYMPALFYYFETGSHQVHKLPGMDLNLWSSCLSLTVVGITKVHHHASIPFWCLCMATSTVYFSTIVIGLFCLPSWNCQEWLFQNAKNIIQFNLSILPNFHKLRTCYLCWNEGWWLTFLKPVWYPFLCKRIWLIKKVHFLFEAP